jgi:enterobactin synthetase component D
MRPVRHRAPSHPLPGGTAHYAVSLPDRGLSDGDIAALGVTLPEALRGGVPRRRTEWALGRYCARRAGEELGGFSGETIGIGGDGGALWPKSFVGSITHKHGFVAAAVARSEDVEGLGIDSEAALGQSLLAEVEQEIAGPAEWRLGSRYAGTELERWYPALVFSAKESLYKCLRPRVGRFFGYRDAAVVEVDGIKGEFVVELLQPLAMMFPRGRQFRGRFHIDGKHVHTVLSQPFMIQPFMIQPLGNERS